jgi:UDP-N-acetylglucosamine diphosphorylase / glucose-1-phosphate thymidylyltransferase / UDP-N-acetylgalactosamine diphosphorylase / glucosamine-1-phosphate N-acetyltransferase / galactosamine-1-phosphate N-acetyltransferase
MLSPLDLFDLSEFAHRDIFADCEFAWAALSKIDRYIKDQFSQAFQPAIHVEVRPGVFIEGEVYIGQGTVIEPGAFIAGPAIIGEKCEIRQGAYIRGNVILGDKAIVGHATEVKNSIFLNNAHAPHFAYVGDSILGNRVNLGAGTRLANVPIFSEKDPVTLKRPTVRIRVEGQEIDTRLSKLGAILGDDAQTGCNTVTNPGCIIGPRTLIYALTLLRGGYYPADRVIKLRPHLEIVERK